MIVALLAALALLLTPGAHARGPQVHWRQSRSLGLPWNGRLVNGVQLPGRGLSFRTWDPGLRRSPDRAWRRWGNDRLVRIVLHVVQGYRRAHPHAPAVLVGDLSRPHGGPFGPEYGGLGHVSHQNGLDVDVYYPRKDRKLLPPRSPGQIDHRLAQELVDRFVRAGARIVFVGPNTRLTGPRGVVRPLVQHDNHMHVRIANARSRTISGRSVRGRSLRAIEYGNPGGRRVLVVGCIHGTECAGKAVVRRLLAGPPPSFDLWVVPNLNPDGYAAGTRQNARGVDLNRNFPGEWRPRGRRWDPQYSGPRPLSEPETRFAARVVRRIRPRVTIWFHQPQSLVRAWGGSIPAARRYARLAGMRFRAIRWPHGTAPNWQNHRFPASSSFVVELPPGPPGRRDSARLARAVRRLAK